MTRSFRSMLVGMVPLLVSGTVFAQAPADEPPAADAAPEGTVVTGTAAVTVDPVPSVGVTVEPVASRYPRDVISRALTYPAGLAALGFDLSSTTSNPADPATVRLLAGYGITDDFELNFGHYAFATNDAGNGTFDLGLGYKLVRGAVDGKLEAIARVQTGYSLAASDFNPLLVGVHAQYNVTPTVGLITPGGQLSVGLAGDDKPVTIGLPVAIGVQATPTVYVQLDTTIATLKIANATSSYLFADTTPLALTVYLNAMPHLDLLATASANLTPSDAMGSVADTVAVLIGARYYVGQL